MQEGKRQKCKRYQLQMMDITEQPFNIIAIDLVTDLSVSMLGHKHILTIIDYLTGWLEAFPFLTKQQKLSSMSS